MKIEFCLRFLRSSDLLPCQRPCRTWRTSWQRGLRTTYLSKTPKPCVSEPISIPPLHSPSRAWRLCSFHGQGQPLASTSLHPCRNFTQISPTRSQGQSLTWPKQMQFHTILGRSSLPVVLPISTGQSPAAQQCSGSFHTSVPARALPAPLIWMVLKPLQKLAAMIIGRSIRKWWKSLPPNKRELFRQSVWRSRWRICAGVCGLAVVVTVFFCTHLDEAPITGRSRLLVFSSEHFKELSTFTAEGYLEEFKDTMVPLQDPRHRAVEMVVRHLVERNQDVPEVSQIPWTVRVVESSDINAFVLANGQVFVFTGMLEAVADVHQLSFILGHEMAHAIIGHTAEQASLVHFVDFLSLILLTAIWAICPRDSLAIVGQWVQSKLSQFMFDRPYSRKLEAEADKVGLQMAAKACADVRAGPVFWQQMMVTETLTGEPRVPEWLSTHPSHENRAEQLDRLIPQALKLRESCNCPALPAEDPRSVFLQSVKLLLQQVPVEKKEGEPKNTRDPPKIESCPVVLPVRLGKEKVFAANALQEPLSISPQR
ncbi:UNVERIFIED_CONTAM: hypothetical protein FKN15_071578 [Acipenser sinensis]